MEVGGGAEARAAGDSGRGGRLWTRATWLRRYFRAYRDPPFREPLGSGAAPGQAEPAFSGAPHWSDRIPQPGTLPLATQKEDLGSFFLCF